MKVLVNHIRFLSSPYSIIHLPAFFKAFTLQASKSKFGGGGGGGGGWKGREHTCTISGVHLLCT